MRAITMLLVVAFSLAGCATYQRPDLPPEQTALLSVPRFRPGKLVEFKKVDGKPLTTASALGLSRARAPVVLAPGKHDITVGYQAGLMHGDSELWLVAEPSKSYLVDCESTGYKFRCWIEDTETKQQVGGFSGSDDEPKQ